MHKRQQSPAAYFTEVPPEIAGWQRLATAVPPPGIAAGGDAPPRQPLRKSMLPVHSITVRQFTRSKDELPVNTVFFK